MFIFRLFWFLTAGIAKLFFAVSFSFVAVVFATRAVDEIRARYEGGSIMNVGEDLEALAYDKLQGWNRGFGQSLAQIDYSQFGRQANQFKRASAGPRSPYRF